MRFSLYTVLLALIWCGTSHAVNPAGVALSHGVPDGYTAGESTEVTVTITAEQGDQITALGLLETVPPGWSFGGARAITGGLPAIMPPLGATIATFEFAWVSIPAFPCTFAYTLNIPASAVERADVVGQVEYRTTTGRELTEPDSVSINAASDTAPACDINAQGFFGWLLCLIVIFFQNLFG